MGLPRRRLARLLLSSALLALGAVSIVQAAPTFDPAYRFRTIATEHFVIYFHQGEDAIARRLATIAEETWRANAPALGRSRPARTHVVLVDQTELANGWAAPFPYNTIMVTASWPAGSEFIGKTDDWLRLVFTHEFTHIVHLDRSEGWARVLRGVFGRTPLTFPNLFLPQWHIEGLATYQESTSSSEGRLHAGNFRAILGEATRARHLEPVDRVNGGLTDWPGSLGAYAYGAGFHQYLAERFGPDTFDTLATSTAHYVPFTASRAFRSTYGQPLGALWRDYQAGLQANDRSESDTSRVRRLTHHGFVVTGPRFDRRRCSGCADSIFYSVRTPHEFPALYSVSLDTSRPQRLVTRYLGATSATGTTAIYFDQQELRRNAGLYSDLYAVDRKTKDVKQLTFGARLTDPDLSPDGRILVCVRAAADRRDLVMVSASDLESGVDSTGIATLVSEPETQFNAPRWSPDGRVVVVERHAPGRQSEIVVVDVTTRAVRIVATEPHVRFVTPTWRPDGRAIVVAADLDEGPFDLYEVALSQTSAFEASRPDPLRRRRLTRTTGGATWPDVSPDGATMVFVGYTVAGFDLFTMPYPPDAAEATQDREPARGEDVSAPERPAASPTSVPSAPSYRPLGTLRPMSWLPVIEGNRDRLRLGFTTGGADVLAYHAYSISATWLATTPSNASLPAQSDPDWQATYMYNRWRPTFWLSASTQTSFIPSAPNGPAGLGLDTLRERQIEGGVLFPIQHVRVSQAALFSVASVTGDLRQPDGQASSHRAAWRAGWTIDSTQTYGYSISPEDGGRFGVTTDLARRGLGSSADAATVTVDGRLYLPSIAPHHVVAVRMAAGTSTGDAVARRTFLLGGGQPNLGTLDFGRDAISLLRGFGAGTFAGSQVALVNADYRWPVARPQRGYGTWPLFVRTVHAAAFADVGHVWTRRFDARDVKSSVGGELSLDVVVGYFAPLTATLGAAWGRDGSGAVPNGRALYVRLGRAF